MAAPGPITCQEIVEIVTEYLEGALPAGERARFEQHLLACDGCAGYLDQMRQTIRLMGKLNEESLAPAQIASLLVAFRTWKRS